MRFEIGNRVAVVDDVLKGIIVAIKGTMIELEDKEGMRYQFHQDDLVLIQHEQHELTKYSDINHPVLREKIHSDQKKKSTVRQNEIVFEVDLHINQLVNSTKRIQNSDMLELQLKTARQKLEFAISKRFSKVIFIHGVGEGILKAELHRLLNRYPVEFYDASYQKYGLGATEVYIYQNPKS